MSAQLIAAGAQQAWLAFVGSVDGIIAGSSPSYPAAGSLSHAIRLAGVQTVPTGLPEADTVSVTGDDSVLGSFDFESEAPTAFVINTGRWDLATVAALQRSLVQVQSGIQFGLLRPVDVQLPDVALIVQSRAKDAGASAWHGFIYPRCTIRPLGREQFGSREAATFRYQVVAQPTTRKPTGAELTQAANGYEAATVIEFASEYPLAMAAFTGDGTATVFSGLQRRPPASTPINAVVALNGVEQTTGFTFDTANLELEFASAPAANARGVLVYGYV